MPDGRPKLVCMATGHRTKAEKEVREKAEKALHTGLTFKESDAVKKNETAHAVFLRLKRLYRDIPFVEALDEQAINRYCIETAEVGALEQLIEKMQTDVDECEDHADRMQLNKTVSGALSTLQRKREMLMKLEDRLFLNPVARLRSIPKQPVKEEKRSGMEEFLRQRNGGGG